MTQRGDRSDRSGPVVVRSVLDPPGQWSAQQALDLLAQGYSAERVVAVTGLDARWVRTRPNGSADGGVVTVTGQTADQARERRERAVLAARHSIEMEGGRVDPETRAHLDAYAAGGLTIEEGLDRVRQRVVAAAGVIRSGDGG